LYRIGNVKSPTSGALQLAAVVLLLLGLMRVSGLVLGEPVAGYANQYDMLRTSACLGFWPLTEGNPKASSRDAPISHYQLGEQDSHSCYPGAEVLIAGAAIKVAGLLGNTPVDLRWIGGFKLFLLMLTALALHWSLRRHPQAALVHAVIFAVVICDPFNMLFANSLYTEFSALLGAYMAIASVSAVMCLGKFRPMLAMMWLLGLALLGGSRVQHMLLPLTLLIPAWWAVRQGSKGMWVAALTIAVVTIGLQFQLQHSNGKIDDANRIDTLFYTVLSGHPQPRQLALKLGIEPACAELTNTSWYLRRGRDHRAECPGAFTLSRLKLIAVLATEPITGIRLIFRAIHQSGAWNLPYVGELAGEDFKKVGGMRGQSIAGLITMMPFALYALFYMLPLWAGFWSGLWLLKHRNADSSGHANLFLAQTMLALLMLIVVMTALFGDGFSEFSRHVHLAHNAAAVSWVILPLLIFSVFRPGLQPQGKRIASLSAITGAIMMIVLVPMAVPKMALGFGVLDVPAEESFSASPIELSGWAMDPNGVASVEVVVEGGKSRLMQSTPSAELERFFPVGKIPVRFHGSLKLDNSIPRQAIQILVTSKSGQKSVIERRWMQPDK